MTFTANISRRLATLSLLLVFAISFGQQREFIEGQLIDSKSETPIPFATIRIKNKSKGVISNIDGGFIIPDVLQKLGDTLVISSIGYDVKEVQLSTLDKDIINVILITEKIESLDEVVVVGSKNKPRSKAKRKEKKLTAREITRLALEQIPDNYPFEPFSYIGYYRDYQLKKGKYVNLNESILKVFDPGFGFEDINKTQIRLYSYKNNTDFPIDTLVSRPYDYKKRSKIIPNATLAGQGGNEYTLLRLHDAIRNHNLNTYDFVNRLDSDLIKNHRLKLLPETSINDIPLYVIRLLRSQENYKAIGKVYISKEDFQIYKMEYAVYDKRASLPTLKEPSIATTVQEKEDIPGKLLYEIIVEYQLDNLKMYPNYISFNNSFDVLQPPKFKPTQITLDKDKKHIEIDFNNTPSEKGALKKSNYKVWFQKVKLSIDSISLQKNTVIIYPKNREDIFSRESIATFEQTGAKNIAIEVKKIKDIDGNEVNRSEPQTYNQFREFFVQELISDFYRPMDTLYMRKNRPISKSQPIIAPENLSEYWMNSPLKN